MNNEKFESDIKVIPALFNKLGIVEVEGKQFLKGELEIIDATGKLWDIYQIEIKDSDNYPFGFPKLFEIADAFPKIAG
ncbi:MAG: hypothetical protein ABIU11_02700, partial [Chitinophagaceae bacterium]